MTGRLFHTIADTRRLDPNWPDTFVHHVVDWLSAHDLADTYVQIVRSALDEYAEGHRVTIPRKAVVQQIHSDLESVVDVLKHKGRPVNRLEMAEDWDLFSSRYQEVWEIFDPKAVNIVDLSTLDPGPRGRRNLVVDVLARDIFKRRTIARRKEELGLVSELPRVWMLIDEAHQFIPAGKSTLAKEGRQPGISLVVASQQPSAIDGEVITQCDVLIAQKLTNRADINALSQDYMGGELQTYIRKLKRRGEAVLVDDEQERVVMAQIRPHKSYHGGGEATK